MRCAVGRSGVLVVTMVLLATMVPIPSGGFHVDDPGELLLEGSGEGQGWVMFRMDLDGEHIIIDMNAPERKGTPIVQTAAMRYDGNLTRQFGFIGTGLYGNGMGGVYVDTDQVGENGTTVNTYDTWSMDGGPASGYDFSNVTGTTYILLWFAGGIAKHDYQVYGPPGTMINEVTRGSDTVLYQTSDFEGPLTTHASLFGFGARAVLDGTLTHTAREGKTVLSSFTSGFSVYPTVDELSVDKPDGTSHECPCNSLAVAQPYADGPGVYTFHASGTSAGSGPGSQIRLTMVEIEIPNQNLP